MVGRGHPLCNRPEATGQRQQGTGQTPQAVHGSAGALSPAVLKFWELKNHNVEDGFLQAVEEGIRKALLSPNCCSQKPTLGTIWRRKVRF